MYKHNVKIGVILALAMLSAFFFACKTSDNVTKHTVTIDLNGGTGLSSTTYTVNDGDTLNITETPTNTAHYSLFKQYINTADNSVFIMGQTKVNGDITLKAEWEFSLKVIRDMMLEGSGIWGTSPTVTFRKVSDTSLDLVYDYTSSGGIFKSTNQNISLVPSDNSNYIAKFSNDLLPSTYNYIVSISTDSLVLYDIKYDKLNTFAKQP